MIEIVCAILFVSTAYMLFKTKELTTEKAGLEDLLALETTVKSLIEVVRQQKDINSSGAIIAASIANLLGAAGLSIYKVEEGEITSILGEYFKNNDEKGPLKNNINEKVISDILMSNSDAIEHYKYKHSFVSKYNHIDVVLCPIKDQGKIVAIGIMFFNSSKNLKKLTDFQKSALTYLGHLLSLTFDIDAFAMVEKIKAERLAAEERERELMIKLDKEMKNSELQNEFIGVISHELRTPLAVISSSNRLMQYDLKRICTSFEGLTNPSSVYANTNFSIPNTLNDLEKLQKQTENINSYVFKLSSLIEGALNLSIVDSQSHLDTVYYATDVNLAQTLKDLEGMLKNYRDDVELEVQILNSDESIVHMDNKHLYLILSNVIVNALKFSKPNTKVSVLVSEEENMNVIDVIDHGVGIPNESISQLFDKFHRASNVKSLSGTGIGLYISKRLLDINNGQISVKSVLGEGSTFTIKIPKAIRNKEVVHG